LRTILYTKDFDININENVNIILSPQFYWIKKIDIPLKSLRTAKKIAKNMFKLDEKEYNFFALKIDNEFYAIAIEKNLNLKIDKKYIKNIYIAQSELKDFECIDANKCILKKVDGILFCFKDKCKNKIDDILQNIKLSNNKINLFHTIEVDKKSFLLINLSIFFISIYFLINGLLYKNSNININYGNLPHTTFQLKSILNDLQLKQKRIKKLKKDLEYISLTPLNKNESFIKLKFDKYFIIEIKTKRDLDFYFKKYFNVQSKLENSIYKATLK